MSRVRVVMVVKDLDNSLEQVVRDEQSQGSHGSEGLRQLVRASGER